MKTNFAPGFTKFISRFRIKVLARTTNSWSLCRTIISLFSCGFPNQYSDVACHFSSSYSIIHTNNSSSNSSSSQQNRHSNPSLATVPIHCDRCIQVRIKLQDQTLSTETIYFQVFLLSFQNSGCLRSSGNQSAFCSHRRIAFSLLLVLELVELIA